MALCSAAVSVQAVGLDKKNDANDSIPAKISLKPDMQRRLAIGVQVGTDIGGAVPFPFKHIPDKFNPYPQLSISLGGKVNHPAKRRKMGFGCRM